MKLQIIFRTLIFVLLLNFIGLSQTVNPTNADLRYPNELKGFELMKNSKLKNLIPGVSTERDVIKVFGEDCKNPHERLKVCELDKDWYVNFSYDGENNSGILWDIQFYPHKRIPFSKVKFPKTFEKGRMGIVHLPIEVTYFITYEDKLGLSYVIIDEKGDSEFKKGDLFYIEYGIPKKKEKPEDKD
jgi:hypothetical protein